LYLSCSAVVPRLFLFFYFVRLKFLTTAPIFFLHRAHMFLYIPTVTGISVHFYGGMVVSLHFKLLYAAYRTNCSSPIHFIFSACFSSFFTCFLCLISRTFSSLIMAITKKPPSTKGKAKASSAKATASARVPLQPKLAPNKKSTAVKHTSPSKPTVAATMDTSFSSESSVSSIDVCDYAVLPDVSDFVPSSLPSGRGTIPTHVMHSFQSTLDIMPKSHCAGNHVL